ncbi:MAG TPA: hypothetical protein PLF72_09610 [Anaerolineaceae bacterium]|nr:hypothetical protein [Anaerolineaceae bacterium]HQO97994.1 hypothetical protein [Anaerolineaceae bacterium]
MTRKHPLILLALLLLVTAALVNTASVTASAPAASPQSFPHSNPLVIPAAAFSDDGYNPSSHMFWFSAGYQVPDIRALADRLCIPLLCRPHFRHYW